MSFANVAGPLCAAISAFFVVILAATDRKRRQLRAGASARPLLRGLVWLAVLAPGLALAMLGRWPDFLIWIGVAAVAGWGVAALFSLQKRRGQDR